MLFFEVHTAIKLADALFILTTALGILLGENISKQATIIIDVQIKIFIFLNI